MFSIFRKKETDNSDAMREEAKRDMAAHTEKVNKIIRQYKEDNPLKYKVKDEVFHWIVFRAVHNIDLFAGYGYFDNINEMKNEYSIINFNTGETRVVDEKFLDDLFAVKQK